MEANQILKNNSPIKVPKSSITINSLTKVLDHSELIKDVVVECAEELSSVNVILKQEFTDQDLLPGIENALETSNSVESKVQDAAVQLTVVNQALESEVIERERLERQLVSVKGEEQAARYAAFHDSLTGLPNRVLFNDRLEHGLTQAKRHGWTLAVMFVDLDEFKSINDVYGHDAGDAVLQAISQRLKEATRVDDTICRHGGDEFLYLLMEIRNKRDITLIAKKIIKVIQEPCEFDSHKLVIKPSIGISIFPKDGESAEVLIKSADKAMYRAKQSKSGYAYAIRT